jgi:hypothetical protein
MGVAFLFLFLFACATKDASGMLCAFFLSLPPLLTAGISPVQFFLYGAAVCAFIKAGRIAVKEGEADMLSAAFREIIDKYEERGGGVNRAIDCSLETFVMDMIRRRIMNED